jgi:uncharacterized protein (DUF2141 family)
MPELKAALAAWLLGIVAGATSSHAATLNVRVESVSPRGGDVRIAIYERAAYSGHDGEPVADKVVTAVAPETLIRIDNIPPGTYAAKLFQDINRNQEFDMDWVGIPQEPFGFSNDAKPLFDQPKFDAAKFDLGSKSLTITVHLRHWAL